MLQPHERRRARARRLNVFIRQLPSGCEIWAPAKINLSLDILHRRDDGFHEIETLITPVGIYDTLRFVPNASGKVALTVQSTWTNSNDPPIPVDEKNLVVKAANLIRDFAIEQRIAPPDSNWAESGADIELIKRIPHAAGLGGGSADAAATLAAANSVWNLDLPIEKLRELAAMIGSDVPAFLSRSPMLCKGRGEQITAGPRLSRLDIVIVKPPVGLSTPEVYAECKPGGEPTDWSQPTGDAVGDCRFVAARMSNGLQNPAEKKTAWIIRLGRVFGGLDVIAHQMSGSGSAYFAVCRHATHAVRVANRIKSLGLGEVFLTANTPGYALPSSAW